MPIFLKYSGIQGDASEPAHRSWIEISSFQWGVGRGMSAPTGGSADRESSAPSVSEIVVTKNQDSATPHLFRAAISGKRGKRASAVIDGVRDDGSVYLRIEMKETMISGHSLSGSGGRPTESLTLNFTKIESTNSPGTPPP